MESLIDLWKGHIFPGFEEPLSNQFNFIQYFYNIQNSLPTNPPKQSANPDIVAFNKWMMEQQPNIKRASSEYVEFYTPEGFPYMGLIATKDVGKDEIIISVNSELALSCEMAYNSELKQIFDKHEECFIVPENVVMVYNNGFFVLLTYILFEMGKKEKSKWYHMFKIWPNSINYLYQWNEQELKELQNKDAQDYIMFAKKVINKYYQKLKDVYLQYPQYFPSDVYA